MHYHINIRHQSSPEEKRSTDQTGADTVTTGLISYIKNDGMNVESKDIYTARIEMTKTKEELEPIRQEYEKEAEVLREAIEEDKAELIEQIVERGYLERKK